MNKKHIGIMWGTIAAVLVVVCIYLFNYNLHYNEKFYETSVTSIISIITAIFISYYLVQKKNDERRNIDNIDRIISKVQSLLSNSELIDASTQNAKAKALLMQKSLASKLEYIKQNCSDEIKPDLEYICNEFEHLRELYGGHIHDNDYLIKSADDFKKYIINIDDKCDALHVKLYQ